MMRRSRRDIELGRRLLIGQEWLRAADETVWRLRQVHRTDCQLELERGDQVVAITFGELRIGWKRILSTTELEAA